MNKAPLSTVTEVCAHLKIGKTSFYRLTATPGFPAPVRFNRKTVRYDLLKIMCFLKEQA